MIGVGSYSIARIKTVSKNSGRINGTLMPLWKDYDPLPAMAPRYIYYATCRAGEEKGPYLHTKRRTLLNLVEGRIILAYREAEVFKETEVNADSHPVLFDIPAGVGYLIRNASKDDAKMVNICDYPWKEGDNETEVPDFSGYKSKL